MIEPWGTPISISLIENDGLITKKPPNAKFIFFILIWHFIPSSLFGLTKMYVMCVTDMVPSVVEGISLEAVGGDEMSRIPEDTCWGPGPWFNIRMSSYQYRISHCGDKTVIRRHLYIESAPCHPVSRHAQCTQCSQSIIWETPCLINSRRPN